MNETKEELENKIEEIAKKRREILNEKAYRLKPYTEVAGFKVERASEYYSDSGTTREWTVLKYPYDFVKRISETQFKELCEEIDKAVEKYAIELNERRKKEQGSRRQKILDLKKEIEFLQS